jgi:hypothetical protein
MSEGLPEVARFQLNASPVASVRREASEMSKTYFVLQIYFLDRDII